MSDARSTPSLELVQLLGTSESSQAIHRFLVELGENSNVPAASKPTPGRKPESHLKAYKDIKYSTFKQLGMSLQYEPQEKGLDASQCEPDELRLVAVDLYSSQHLASVSLAQGWKGFSRLPLVLHLVPEGQRPRQVTIGEQTTGRQLVELLGEPARKGGGGAHAVGGMGPAAWMEWNLELDSVDAAVSFKLMVELGGLAARGSDRWDPARGGAATWKTMTLIRYSGE